MIVRITGAWGGEGFPQPMRFTFGSSPSAARVLGLGGHESLLVEVLNDFR